VKIGIIGSQGVGKTTLAATMAEELDIYFIEEQIREVVKRYNPLGYKTPDDLVGSMWYPHMMLDIYEQQLEKELSAKDGFVSDRTTLDYYAYYKVLNCDSSVVTDLFEKAFLRHYKNHYDLVIFVPIAFPVLNDNYRNTDETFRLRMDTHLRDIMYLNQNVYILNGNTLSERVEEVKKLIDSITKKDQTII